MIVKNISLHQIAIIVHSIVVKLIRATTSDFLLHCIIAEEMDLSVVSLPRETRRIGRLLGRVEQLHSD